MYFGLKDVSISYGKRSIIDDITLEFPKGKIITIIGQNGCGKSSILKVLTKGKSKIGNIFLKEKELFKYKKRDRARTIAYLPQIHYSPDDITVETLVGYGRFPYLKGGRVMTKEDKEIIADSIEKSGISHLSNQMVNTLSGGEKQRAWIAMTICQQPEILILDEPTTYLDVCYQIEVLELVKKLNKEFNMTIIMVLHDLNLASQYSDYLYVIKGKKLYKKGTPKEILTKENLRTIFNIEAEVHEEEYPYYIPKGVVKTNEA